MNPCQFSSVYRGSVVPFRMLSTRETLSKDDEASASSGPALLPSDTPLELPADPVTDAAHQLIGKRVRVRPYADAPPPPCLTTAGLSLHAGQQ